jgi:hypothetical protein
MIRWRSLGRIIDPRSQKVEWLRSYAGATCLRFIREDHAQILVTGRTSDNKSIIGEITIRLTPSPKVVEIIEQPVLSPGKLGCFDDCGVSYPWIVGTETKEWLFFTGWTQTVKTPFQNALGLAHRNGDTYCRESEAPILHRTNEEPFSIGSSCIHKDSNHWRMWYTCFESWNQNQNSIEPRYHIRNAWSKDGVDWERNGSIAINSTIEEECIARPSASKTLEGYKMFFCARGESYRIGYAESEDGIKWEKPRDGFQFISSGKKWDDEMQCYPCHFVHNEQEYMLYSGNSYGQGGLGLAIKA